MNVLTRESKIEFLTNLTRMLLDEAHEVRSAMFRVKIDVTPPHSDYDVFELSPTIFVTLAIGPESQFESKLTPAPEDTICGHQVLEGPCQICRKRLLARLNPQTAPQ